jgi:antitoxin ParD1/3/4
MPSAGDIRAILGGVAGVTSAAYSVSRSAAADLAVLANFAIRDTGSKIPTAAPAMPIRNISLTATQDAFVERMLRTGTYQNASEAVRDALRLLQQRRLEDAGRLKQLRRHIKSGLADLAGGDYVEVDSDDLEAFFAEEALEPGQTSD